MNLYQEVYLTQSEAEKTSCHLSCKLLLPEFLNGHPPA